jgi:uncharacterized protein YdhG (YjbR/CyaY superfamily)
MVTSQAPTVEAYLAALPAERRAALQKVRSVIRENLAPGFEEGMQYGMIGYYIPLSRYPETYNGQALTIAGLAAQKQYLAVYLMTVYGDPATRRWFEREYRASGKRLDMGKSCVRFRSLDDLPVDLVGEAIRRVTVDGYIDHYEKTARGKRHAAARATAQPSSKNRRKPVTRKPPAAKKAAAAPKQATKRTTRKPSKKSASPRARPRARR